jgi:hypothetical protein
MDGRKKFSGALKLSRIAYFDSLNQSGRDFINDNHFQEVYMILIQKNTNEFRGTLQSFYERSNPTNELSQTTERVPIFFAICWISVENW